MPVQKSLETYWMHNVTFLFIALLLYSHVPYHNDTIIKTHTIITDAMIKTQEDFFIKIYIPLTLLQRFKKVVCGFTVRGSWRPSITEIFWPPSYGRQHCVLLVLQGCSNGALESTLLGAGFPYYTSSVPVSKSTRLSSTPLAATQLSSFCSIRRPYITFKLPHGDMDMPLRLCNFFRYLAIGMCLFRYLWNGLCDRHRAEITVMQFRGHSLPVRQSMRV